MQDFFRKKVGAASLFLAAVWYFLTKRALPFLFHNAVALLTFLYFFFILGTSGGVDIRLMTDEQAVQRCSLGFMVWIACIALVQIGKGLYRRTRQ